MEVSKQYDRKPPKGKGNGKNHGNGKGATKSTTLSTMTMGGNTFRAWSPEADKCDDGKLHDVKHEAKR